MFFLFKQYVISQTKKDKTAGVSLYNVYNMYVYMYIYIR